VTAADARGADLVGREEGDVAAEEGDRDLGRRVLGAAADRGDQVAGEQADRESAASGEEEAPAGLGGREAGPDRSDDRDLVDDQGAGVVDQALALEHVDDPARDPGAAQDRRRGDRVGRADDRAEGDRHRPGEVEGEVCDRADDDRGRQHQPDREQRDHPGVVAQGVEVGEESARVEQRRQEDQQHEVGVELDLRDPRHQAERQPAEHEDDRIRHLPPVGKRVQQRHRDQQSCDENLDLAHRSRTASDFRAGGHEI
jgi:hypothetical protein